MVACVGGRRRRPFDGHRRRGGGRGGCAARGRGALARGRCDDGELNRGRMFANGPCNIGIACRPSGLLVVDEDGVRNLAAYAGPLGLEVSSTRVSKTGRGAHLLFRHDHDADPVGNTEGLLADFDVNIRGAGVHGTADPASPDRHHRGQHPTRGDRHRSDPHGIVHNTTGASRGTR
ncbi:bifunctional DNA primase/polymerase [Pedococcus sp. 5OH_020]|uniref:bifunctional DNA primase/polymerase n=1 Tax=Pedococcus sp. 5OH_020 TaxID=2989814 RepID=UPI003FA68CC7